MQNQLLRFIALCFALLVGVENPCLLGQDYRVLAQKAVAEAKAEEKAISLEARQYALAKLQEAKEKWLKIDESVAAAQTLISIGTLYRKINLPQQSLAAYQEALSLLKLQADAQTEIDALNGLGETYNYLSQVPQAKQVTQQAINQSDAHRYLPGKALALLLLSDAQDLSNHEEALKTAQAALTIWQALNDRIGIAKTLTKIGQYQLTLSDLDKATRSYDEALLIWRENDEKEQQARVLVGMGSIAYRQGDWQKVFTLMQQAEPLLDPRANPAQAGRILTAQGDTFLACGMPEAGLLKHQQAREIFRQANDEFAVMVTTWTIGKAYYLLGKYEDSLAHLQEAMEMTRHLKDTFLPAFINETLGQVYFSQGDYTKALAYFRRAFVLHQNATAQKEAAQVLALIGQTQQKLGNLTLAGQSYQNALKTFRRLSDHVNEGSLYYTLGRLKVAQGQVNEASNYFQRAIDITENQRAGVSLRDLATALSATVQNRYEAYIDCLMRQQRYSEAFTQSEMGRARSLGESLRQMQTIPGLEPQLAVREKVLRQSLMVKQDAKVALLSHKYQQEELAALDAEIVRLESEYAQVEADIKARYPAYAQIAQPVVWDLARIQQEVVRDDETILLEYSLGEQHSYLWAVTRNGFESYQLPARADIETAATRFHKLLSEKPVPANQIQLNQAAQELSQMILAPVAAHSGKRRWLIAADGALHYVPFQALPAPAGNELLLAQHEVVNVPSATISGLLVQEAAQRAPADKFVAAFGDPVFPSNYAQRLGTAPNGTQVAQLQSFADTQLSHALRGVESDQYQYDPQTLPGLFYAGREMAYLRSFAPGSDSLINTGFAATRDNLQKTDLRQYHILHFATHGLLNSKQPEFSGLVLSLVDQNRQPIEGFVSLSDVYNLRAPVDLVVLSACQTALGQEVRGEGLIGLTRGFMYAGASSVAASLWEVDDETTAELMKLFYANMLQKEMPPAEALRAAQNEIRQQPGWSAPHYWAAFTLQGEYRQVIKPSHAWSRATQATAGAGVLLATLAGLALWRRRKRRNHTK